MQENFDFLETCSYGCLHTPVTCLDHIAVSAIDLWRDHRWLDDADSLYRGEKQRVSLSRRFRLARIVGIFVQRARIDLDNVYEIAPVQLRNGMTAAPFRLHSFARHFPDRGPGGPAQLRPSSPAPNAKRGLKPCEGRGAGMRRWRLSVSGGGLNELRPGFFFFAFPLPL